MEKLTYIGFGIFILIIFGGFFFFRGGGSTINGNIVSDGGQVLQGETQKVVLSIKDYNYYPNTINVKVNQPIKLSLDNSVTGCLRNFNIKDLGISKTLRTPQETIDFTPTKKGTFRFACSMGMGYGNLIVE